MRDKSEILGKPVLNHVIIVDLFGLSMKVHSKSNNENKKTFWIFARDPQHQVQILLLKIFSRFVLVRI